MWGGSGWSAQGFLPSQAYFRSLYINLENMLKIEEAVGYQIVILYGPVNISPELVIFPGKGLCEEQLHVPSISCHTQAGVPARLFVPQIPLTLDQ